MNVDIVRAWRDAKYRRSLTAEQRRALPEHPAGLVELSDDQLRAANGLFGKPPPQTTALTCTEWSFKGWKACGCGVATTAITCTEYSWGGFKGCCPG
ncbi:MAG: mersacidin/lichenicidin family type 2 lantibiotic [Planctomycetes bacterium]|nr:mersacidin/lichenicidin family type 2 lantibiotic [Planctomycetota bacterium]